MSATRSRTGTRSRRRRRPRERRTCSSCSTTTPGCAAWSPYGGRIEMPTLQRLADDGLTYSQWHTTALCSPTRSTFLTGRNHHSNGFASISESSTGFPGYSSHIPPENGTIAHVLRDARLQHVLGRQEPQRPGRRVDAGLLEEGVAAGAGLRPLLRLHRRRDQQLVSRPRRGQPLHRPAVPARGRLSPLEGPRRPGAAASSATPSSPSPRSPGTCGSARAPTTPRTTRRRSTSTSTRAPSTTATRPTASGSCRA